MKKLRILKLEERNRLTNDELRQLKGARDVDNTNYTVSCSCTFYNPPSATTNTNWVATPGGCSCTCTY